MEKEPSGMFEVAIPYGLAHAETLGHLRQLLDDPAVARHLGLLRDHHPDSYEHCVRVGALSLDLALDRTTDLDELRTIGLGGLLHDLGKCDIAEELLSGTSMLTSEERVVMQAHTRTGFDRLADDPAFKDVRKIVVSHHELKKHPYPRSGNERRASEREEADRRENDGIVRVRTGVVAAADMLDALSCARSYKAALPKGEVERILREQFIGEGLLIDAALERI